MMETWKKGILFVYGLLKACHWCSVGDTCMLHTSFLPLLIIHCLQPNDMSHDPKCCVTQFPIVFRRTVSTIYALQQLMRECIVRQSRMHAVDFVYCRTLRVRKTLMIGAPVVDVVDAMQEVLAHLEVPVTVTSHHWKRDFIPSPNV